MFQSLTPVEQSLAYREIFAKGKAEGEADGVTKGEAKGKIEGEALVLQRVLQRRFGPLSPAVQRRIAAASEAQIEVWVDAILDAPNLKDLLRRKPSAS